MEPNEYPIVKAFDADIAAAERKLNELKEAREAAVIAAEAEKADAPRLISDLIEKAHAIIREAEEVADRTGTSFQFDLAYGMGGSYYPVGSPDWSLSGNQPR